MDFSINYKQRSANFRMVEPHFHSCYEIYYLLEGHRTFFINHSFYSLQAHSLVLIPKLEIHRSSNENPSKHNRYVLYLAEDTLSQLTRDSDLDWRKLFTGSPLLQIPEEAWTDIEHLLDCTEQEFSQNKLGRDLLLESYLKLLLVKLIRIRQSATTQQPPAQCIELAAAYIAQNFSAPIQLEDAARSVNLSPSYFSHRFHKETGFRFKEYLNQVRLRHASELLIQSQKSITDIAMECGFESSNYFGDRFCKTFGCSPREYRIRHGKTRFSPE